MIDQQSNIGDHFILKIFCLGESLVYSSSLQYQEEIRTRVDAFIMSIKEQKAKEQRMHLALLFSSPLLIFFQSQNSKNRYIKF